jgi:hypothetical protein
MGSLTIIKEVKLSCNKSWRLGGGGGDGILVCILTLTADTAMTSELSALRAGRTLPSRKFVGTHFSYRLSRP